MNIEQAFNFSQGYETRVEEAASYLRPIIDRLFHEWPEMAIVLGSGSQSLAHSFNVLGRLDFTSIPNFPDVSTEGHREELLFGTMENLPMLMMTGRVHYYQVAGQAYNADLMQLSFPIDLLANLGIKAYIPTNATGGLQADDHEVGDLVVVESHMSEIPNPLMGRMKNFKKIDGSPLDRFPSMRDAYNPELSDMLLKSFGKGGASTGIYQAVTGPTFESPAEVTDYRLRGADTIGMSMAPEVVVAHNRGMLCAGLNIITNVYPSNGKGEESHNVVLSANDNPALKAKLKSGIERFVRTYRSSEFRKSL